MEGEYESRLSELQSDLVKARKELGDHQNLIRQTEKDKATVLQELVEQNHRLNRELSQVRNLYIFGQMSRQKEGKRCVLLSKKTI